MEERFFKISVFSDFVNNLDKLRLSCKNYNIEENPIELKWIVIHLYMALQSSFILSLSQSNVLKVIKGKYECAFDKKYKFKLSYFEDQTAFEIIGNEYSINYNSDIYETLKSIFTKEDSLKNLKDKEKKIKTIHTNLTKLIPISDLYERICFKNIDVANQQFYSKSFVNNSDYDILISKIIELRNNFIHFLPMTWYFTKEEILRLVPESLKIISFLALESNTINYYNDQDKNKIENILLEINEIIKEVIKVVEGN